MDNWFGGSITGHKVVLKGSHNSGISVNLVPLNATATDTPVQEVMKSAGKATSKVIGSGGDILAAPGVWMKNIQANWPTIMVCGTIIMLCVVFFYCVLRRKFLRSQYGQNSNNFVDLARILNTQVNQLQHHQQQLPLQQQPTTLSVQNLPVNTSRPTV